MAVPLFLLISTALYFRKGVPEKLEFNLVKLYKRAVKPYIIVVSCVFILSLLFGLQDFCSACSVIVHKMGFGPGSYYVPMFVLYSLILPITCHFFTNNKRVIFLSIFLVVISFLSVQFLNADAYRILPGRYLFLIPLGYLWAGGG